MNPTNLNDYFSSQGKALPTVSQRVADATSAGITNYTGSASQNTQLLNHYLKSSTQPSNTNPAPVQSSNSPLSTYNAQNVTASQLTSAPKTFTVAQQAPSQTLDYKSYLNNAITQAQKEVQQYDTSTLEQNNDAMMNEIKKLSGYSQADAYQQQYMNDPERLAKQQRIKDLSQRIVDLGAQYDTIYNNSEKALNDSQRMITANNYRGELGVIADRVDRERAAKVAGYEALKAVEKDDLESYQSSLDQMLKYKYQDRLDEVKAKQDELNYNYDKLNKQQQKKADALSRQYKLEEQQISDAKDNEKQVMDLVKSAATNGLSQQPGGANLLYKASQAKTPAEAAIALGQWAGDYWQTQQIKQAIEISKANLSKIYAETAQTTAETANKFTNVAGGIVAGYNIGKYATDPTHESSVAKLYSNLSSYNFNDSTSIDKAIKNASSTSPITGQMILNASKQFGVDPKMVFAMMQQDSSLGTAGMGARNNNPGNIAQFDHLNKPVKGYATLQDGVNAVAQWLGKNKAPESVAVLNLKEKYNELNTLSNSEYLSNAVGPNSLARSDFSSWYTGGKQNFLGTAQNLLSKETLDALINAKAGGATFGALSDAELKMLHTAATKLNQWAMRDDKGNVTGFNIDEPSFKSELDNVKKLTKAAIERAGGSTIDLADSGVLNDYYSSVNNSILTAASTQAYGGYKY